jgi:hypothetical protein
MILFEIQSEQRARECIGEGVEDTEIDSVRDIRAYRGEQWWVDSKKVHKVESRSYRNKLFYRRQNIMDVQTVWNADVNVALNKNVKEWLFWQCFPPGIHITYSMELKHGQPQNVMKIKSELFKGKFLDEYMDQ